MEPGSGVSPYGDLPERSSQGATFGAGSTSTGPSPAILKKVRVLLENLADPWERACICATTSLHNNMQSVLLKEF
jgi:hypothetical protein